MGDRGFGGEVGGADGGGSLRRCRRRGDDDPAAAPVLQVRNSALDRLEDAMQIDGEHVLPQLVRNVLNRTVRIAGAEGREKAGFCRDAGIGEYDIEAAVLLRDAVKLSAQDRAVGEIDDFPANVAASARRVRRRRARRRHDRRPG